MAAAAGSTRHHRPRVPVIEGIAHIVIETFTERHGGKEKQSRVGAERHEAMGKAARHVEDPRLVLGEHEFGDFERRVRRRPVIDLDGGEERRTARHIYIFRFLPVRVPGADKARFMVGNDVKAAHRRHVEIIAKLQLAAIVDGAATGDVIEGGLSVVPYNVYAAKDGYVAIIVVTEGHWQNLLAAMERVDLANDARYATNKDRVAHMDEVDALVAAWTASLSRDDVFAAARQHGVPAAPVRELAEVLEDPHMHGRGMLAWIDHPELGRIVVPNSPLRFHGAPSPAHDIAPSQGEDNRAVFVDWLGLDEAEFTTLRDQNVI